MKHFAHKFDSVTGDSLTGFENVKKSLALELELFLCISDLVGTSIWLLAVTNGLEIRVKCLSIHLKLNEFESYASQELTCARVFDAI